MLGFFHTRGELSISPSDECSAFAAERILASSGGVFLDQSYKVVQSIVNSPDNSQAASHQAGERLVCLICLFSQTNA